MPPPRPVVVSTGARITADGDRLTEVYTWFTEELANIVEDPTFLIESIPGDVDAYPWETLILEGDTARFQYRRTDPDVRASYEIYAHLHLMKAMGRLDEWLPDASDAEGYELERATVNRMSDTWLLGRSVFSTSPYRLLDELVYANEGGFLDAFLLTARSDEFVEEREAWMAENPGRMDEYQAWFQETFETEPPGVRGR